MMEHLQGPPAKTLPYGSFEVGRRNLTWFEKPRNKQKIRHNTCKYRIKSLFLQPISKNNMATITLEKSLLNEMSHIMGNDDLMAQTIKFVRSIRRKAKAKEAEWEYVPNAETRAAIEECESGADLETLDITSFKDYVKSL